jgi:hypothetical protein
MDPFRGPVPETYVLGSEFPRGGRGPSRQRKNRASLLGLEMARAPQTGWLKELWAEDRGDDSICIPEITARDQPHIALTQVPPWLRTNSTKLPMTKEQRIVCSAFPRRLVATDRATQHKRGSRYWGVSQCLSLGVQHTLSRSGPEAKNPRDEIQPFNWHLTAGERKEIADRASDSGTDAAIAGRKGLGPGYAPPRTRERASSAGGR